MSSAGKSFGTQSPPLEATGEEQPMGVSSVDGGKPKAVPDSQQRQGERILIHFVTMRHRKLIICRAMCRLLQGRRQACRGRTDGERGTGELIRQYGRFRQTQSARLEDREEQTGLD